MISPTTAPHYTWADICDGWKLVDTGQVHQARNESGADVEFLVISDGISRDDRVEV